MTDQSSLPAGAILSHYRIVEKIGAGGMGEVYLALDTELDRSVAIKILPTAFASDQDRLKRFVQEAKAASALNHPHILTIHEIGRTDSTRFIATEFIEGETLRQHMRASSMKILEVLGVAIQVAGALAAAHEAGIVHRDIKPENIMLRKRDQIVKVLDFGLAKLTEQKADEADSQGTATTFATTPGAVMGTLSYLSPEQARGLEVDAQTDIWSLGVVLFEMTAGCLPFQGSTSNEVLASILSEKEQPPLARYSREAPAELERIVSKALRKTREERYQTIKDLMLDLQALKQHLEFESHRERATPPELKARAANGIKHPKITVALVVLLVLSAALGIGSYLRTPGSEGVIDSIAILPFVMIEKHDPEAEYLSGGVTENLINSLTPLTSLNVIGFSTVSRFKGPDIDPLAIGRTLGVRTVLTGQIIQNGDNLSISTRLEDVEGKPIWGKQYSIQKSDLLSVQREIVLEITVKLKLNLSSAERSLVTKVYTSNPEAYQLYMLGLYYWRMRGEALLKSIEYFTQATDKDPNFALAYSGLAAAYNLLPNYSIQSPKSSFPKAMTAARKALVLDKTLPEAHTALARALFSYDWNVPESDKEYLTAIGLDPKYPTAHQWYSRGNLALTKRFDEANLEMKLAQTLDPLSLTVSADLAFPYLYARQPDQALEFLKKTSELATKLGQDIYYIHIYLGMAYEMKGSFQQAIAEYQKAKGSGDPFVLGLLGHAFAASGKREEALGMLDKLKSAKGYVAPYYFAIVHAGLNDKDQAFQWLEKSYGERDVQMTGLNVDPLLDNLRTDNRFTDLIQRVGMPAR